MPLKGNSSNLNVISLFTGAGGLDLGFEAAGFRTTACVEFDNDCCETIRANRSWQVITDDIHNVTSDQILDTAGLKVAEVDVLIGGPPCQPFTVGGLYRLIPSSARCPPSGAVATVASNPRTIPRA